MPREDWTAGFFERVKPKKPERDRDGVPWTGGCPKKNCVLAAGHDGPCKKGAVEEEDYEVEHIEGERSASRNKTEYFVKWKGWPRSDNTWEPRDVMLADAECSVRVWELLRQRLLADPDVTSQADRKRMRAEISRQLDEEEREAKRAAKEEARHERDAQSAAARLAKEEAKANKEAEREAERVRRQEEKENEAHRKQEAKARQETERARDLAKQEEKRRRKAAEKAERAALSEAQIHQWWNAPCGAAEDEQQGRLMAATAAAATKGVVAEARGSSGPPRKRADQHQHKAAKLVHMTVVAQQLRPACVVHGCSGEGERCRDGVGGEAGLRCRRCGATWQSAWWAAHLASLEPEEEDARGESVKKVVPVDIVT